MIQGVVGAGSSTAGYAGTEGRSVEVEPAKRDQDRGDLFLSFGGYDGYKLARILYRRLTAFGVRVLKDCGTLRASEELLLSIHSSKIYIPIISASYARSSRCLNALALMIEQASESKGKIEVLPVFYDIVRSDVQLASIYREALDMHRRRRGPDQVKRWQNALVEAANVDGWERSSYKGDGELVAAMVRIILYRLIIKYNCAPKYLATGDFAKLSRRALGPEDHQKLAIMELLELEVNDVRIVGIHGRDGIGKTALAKIIYDQISLQFDACSFLVDIEETAQQPGGVQYLETKLIFDILKREYEIASAFKGVRFFKDIFRSMKVLVVLDDVERQSLLKEFVGPKLDWFGSGSRIIITSKQKSILQGFVDQGLAYTYDVKPMDDNRALDLFWQYAMEVNWEHHPYDEIALEIVNAVEGLPLLVKVLGSILHGKNLEQWIIFRYFVQQFQHDYEKILIIVCVALGQKKKQMYLDIACFLPDVDCRIASYLWHDYDCPHDEIEVLRCMSLIEMEENKIGMHSMLRCVARKIINEDLHDPGTCIRLFIPAVAPDTKKSKTRTDQHYTEAAGYKMLQNATFLSLGRANVGGKFADALLNVRWLQWQGCPRDFKAMAIHLKNVVILDLSWSKVMESWGFWKGKKMECLKVLNLTGCVDLLVIPSFSCCPNLEMLILERCSRLVHLDPSINDLKHLVTLNLKFCTELSMLPVEMGGMIALRELLIDGTSVRQLPESIGKLVQLQIFSATKCFSLFHVPGSVFQIKVLSVLALDDAKILEIPYAIGDLRGLRRLSLRSCCGLRKLPESIGMLADSLEELDMSGTGISKLPDSTKKLWCLRVLKMVSCFLRELPHYIGDLIDLEELHASWCKNLEGVIPSGCWKLLRLRELRLAGTRISSLPSEIRWLSSLETLDLLHCDLLEELPPLPPNLISLHVNPGLKQKMQESSKVCRRWHLS